MLLLPTQPRRIQGIVLVFFVILFCRQSYDAADCHKVLAVAAATASTVWQSAETSILLLFYRRRVILLLLAVVATAVAAVVANTPASR